MKKLSLKIKLYALVVVLLLLMGGSMIITAQLSLSSMEEHITKDTSELVQNIVVDRLKATAGQYGEMVSGIFNTAYKVPETFREVIQRNVEASSSGRMSRRDMSDAVGSILKGQPQLSSIYAQFEPDAYDGQDRYFTDGVEDHSSDAGTLEIYYFRSPDGKIQFSRTEDPAEKYREERNEFGIREAEWYLCSRDTLKPCTMEPYDYEVEEGYNELMTSLVMPILNQGEFAGVIGVDLNLSTIQKTIKNVSQELYDGAGRVMLVSEKGLIAGTSHYEQFLGRPLSEALPDKAQQYRSLVSSGEIFDDGDVIAVAFPVDIDASGSQWSFIVELPREVALAQLSAVTQLLSEEVDATAARQMTAGIIVSTVSLILLILLVRSVIRPLNEIRDRMVNLASAEGDLTRELKIDTHAELIALADGFNAFLSKLRQMINDLKNINHVVSEQAGDVRRIAVDTEQNTARQHAEIDSVVTAMNEMSAAASEVATFASDAAGNARQASDSVESTQATLGVAVGGVQELAADMEQASSAIGHVAERSDDINRILEVIRGIAEQTNLLALNAAIEAARAGEQGRGFAVVADEVRTLASKTRESTDEISQMIDGLQQEVQQTVTVIRGGVDRATTAVDRTRSADESLAEVVGRIATIVEHVTQVATAAEEQSSVSEEINRNLTIIGDAASDLRDLAQSVRGSGESLGEQVVSLEQQLDRLKT
ncbi:MAG: chemotaxis protein [Alteromonadaceae bacterium]|uniref:methyl-accepting chemotaxis protein n=1 Tax=Marinobacter sp. V034 TaxID=3459610 RepID=UPI000C5BFC08|nr:chemotaxis protein [Alteromonadaceae bacterium]MBH84637.1 chemotaxis protein [Alteromonadaceae bacterium]|tara:strand:- start:33016 stop:35142 length:2127 start_codon:yes stop_codon:yes gene_type:complete